MDWKKDGKRYKMQKRCGKVLRTRRRGVARHVKGWRTKEGLRESVESEIIKRKWREGGTQISQEEC